MSRGGPKANKRRANARKRALDALISPETQKDLQGLRFDIGQDDSAEAQSRKAKSKIETFVKTETQQDLEGLVVGPGEGEGQMEQRQEQVEEEHADALMEEDIKEDEAESGAGNVKPEDIKAEEIMDLL